jgi:cleavage and polyadenylation specificity factor subunit 5
MSETIPTTTTLYNLEEYTFGIGAKKSKSHSSNAVDVATRRRARFVREGTRRSVRAVVLVHSHEHPHVLLLQRKEDGALRLPGGALRPGEEDQAGLARKLSAQLASASLDPPQWDVGLFLGQLWRTAPFDDADAEHALYPYVAPHVSKPRECVKVFLVSLPVSSKKKKRERKNQLFTVFALFLVKMHICCFSGLSIACYSSF